jgi:deoxyadenosine/deoxycytidine kinase
MSRAYGATTQSGSAQQAVTGAYRSVTEPSIFEDYDLYEMHHRPSESTHFSYYNASYDPNANGGETGSLI